ncbi:hypothetical protein BgiMline_029588, partial [Biomphalaria glabrata]
REDISEETDDISGETDDISGDRDDISGETDDIFVKSIRVGASQDSPVSKIVTAMCATKVLYSAKGSPHEFKKGQYISHMISGLLLSSAADNDAVVSRGQVRNPHLRVH